MRFPTLVFDIETLTDLKAGAHLYHLDLPEADVEQALTKSAAKNQVWIFSVCHCMKSFVSLVYGLMNRALDCFLLVESTIQKLKFYRNFYLFLTSAIHFGELEWLTI